MQNHGSKDDLARISQHLIIQVLDHNLALISHVINRQQGLQCEDHVVVRASEFDLESVRSKVPNCFLVLIALFVQIAIATDCGVTNHIFSKDWVGLAHHVDYLMPEVVGQSQANKIEGEHGGLTLIRVTDVCEVTLGWNVT